MKILFICTGNSCRSQMAEGLAKSFRPKGWKFQSAGTHPSFVHPSAIDSMNEIGIDISQNISKQLDVSMIEEADWVVTLCDSAKACVYLPSFKKTLHWPIPDPTGHSGSVEESMMSFRRVRELIQQKLEDFFNKEKNNKE